MNQKTEKVIKELKIKNNKFKTNGCDHAVINGIDRVKKI